MRARTLLVHALVCGVIAVMSSTAWGQKAAKAPRPLQSPDRPWEVIDVAIALDTSGSMEPLIDAARLKLWEIVHDLTLAEPTPRLRVALLSYGNRKNDFKAGWVRVETDLTADLDLVSERLFALTSGPGGEYVARVLQTALEELSWTESRDALKLIFVVGNESADQDPKVSFRDMSDMARRQGYFVSAIFCGTEDDPNAATWRELAERAEGQFASIDHRAGTVVVNTPFDQELAELGAAINETFLPLGREGRRRWKRLGTQDENAERLDPAAAASRAQVKATRLYASGWDLVELIEEGEVVLWTVEVSQLPESLRAMSPEERELHVEELQWRREELRTRIAELSAKRRQYVASQMEAKGLDDSRAYDAVVREALRRKLEENGFRVPVR